jgi:hypothetical protein
MCAARSPSPPSITRKVISTATRAAIDLCQRPTASVQGLERRHHRVPQWWSTAHSRHQASSVRPGRCQAGGMGQWQARRVPVFSSSPAPMSSIRWTRSGTAAPDCVDPALREGSVISDRTQTIRAAVDDVQFTLLSPLLSS